MTKQSLIDYVAEKAEMSKAEAGRALDAVLDGIGKFSVKERPAREGINPATKEKITIPAKNAVTFKAGSKLKDAVQ